MGGRGDGPEVKKQCWMEVSQPFLSETVVIVLGTYRTEDHALTNCANPRSKQAFRIELLRERFFFTLFQTFLTNSRENASYTG